MLNAIGKMTSKKAKKKMSFMVLTLVFVGKYAGSRKQKLLQGTSNKITILIWLINSKKILTRTCVTF
jgi:hypothetical protein